MRRLRLALLVVSLGFALCVGCAAAPYRVLLVDGTKTLEATLRVGGLAGAIRQSGLAEVSVLFSDVTSPFDDPLAGREAPASPFDLMIWIPRGIGDGTYGTIWVFVGSGLAAQPEAAAAFAPLSAGIGLAFSGAARVQGPLDDLWALLISAFYESEGWLR